MEERMLLESWKEIASYLKRSVSTCQRWEEEFGLPIHRLNGTPRAHIFAYPDELDRWLADKLNHIDRIEVSQQTAGPKRRPWLAWTLGLVGVMAVIGVVAVSSRPALFRKPLEPPLHNPFLAILPFDNPAKDPNLEDWTNALPDLIFTDLRQSRLVNAIPFTSVLQCLRDLKILDRRFFTPEDLKRIADKSRVDYALTGSMTKNGEKISVHVSLWDPKTSAAKKEIRVEAPSEDRLFGMVDQLSRDIKLALSLTERQVDRDIDRAVSRISTRSPEAFRLYSRARRYGFERYLPTEPSLRQAYVPLLEEAVGLDPKFGLAYFSLYNANFGYEHSDDLVKYAERAFRLAGRVSEREKLLQLADYYYWREPIDKQLAERKDLLAVWTKLGPRDLSAALKVNERLWSLYPDYPENDIGELYLLDFYVELEEWEKAVRILEKLNLKGKDDEVINKIIEYYKAMGLSGRAEKILNDRISGEPGTQDWPGVRVGIALDQGRYEDALKYLDARYPPEKTRNYNYYSQAGYIHWARGDFPSAERVYRVVFDPKDALEELQRLRNLEVLALSRGQVGRALELARRQLDLSGSTVKDGGKRNALDSRIHYDLAYLLRLSGRLEEALKEAEEACRDYEKRGIRAAATPLHLRALLALELNRLQDFDRLAEEIRRFIEKGPRPKFMRIYYHLQGCRAMKAGNIAEAIAHFEKAQELVAPGQSSLAKTEPEPAKYFFALAEAYEMTGDRDKSMWRGIHAYWKVQWPVMKGSFSGDLYARSFYKVAKVFDDFSQTLDYRSASSRARAIENYRRFLGLWADADPIFPEVKDAKQRLAALESR